MYKTIRNWKKYAQSLKDRNMSNLEIIAELQKLNIQELNCSWRKRRKSWLARRVFALNDHIVIKVCKNRMGACQNAKEIEVHDQLKWNNKLRLVPLAKIMRNESDTYDYRFVIMERCKTTISDNSTRSILTAAKKHTTIEQLILKHTNINIVDIDWTAGNLGINKKGKVVAIDYGCTKSISALYSDMKLARTYRRPMPKDFVIGHI